MTDDDVIRIPLRARDGSVRAWAIVDREDADLAELCWGLGGDGYAQRCLLPRATLRGSERLHRVILSRIINRQMVPSEQCDHVNGDRLDNRRHNLRVATHGENAVNRKAHGASVYLGVHRDRQRWAAQIRPLGSGTNGRRLYLGAYATEEEAARAYDRAAREHHGEFARLNFPQEVDA